MSSYYYYWKTKINIIGYFTIAACGSCHILPDGDEVVWSMNLKQGEV